MRSLPLAIGLISFAIPAHAGPLAEDLAPVRESIASGDAASASGQLDSVEKGAEALGEVVDSAALARYWFYRGVVDWMKDGNVDDGGSAWRMALIVDNEFQWDEDLVKDRDAQDFFLALRAEVRSRPLVNPGVPEATGEARIYVDGIRVRAGDLVLDGTHLAQIRCPDLATFGEWSSFTKAPKYFKKCPGGVDVTVVVEESEDEDDDFGDMGPAFGGGDEAAAPAGPPPDPVQDVTDTVARGAGIIVNADGTTSIGGDVEVIRKKVIWPAFAGGVVAAGAAGALQVIALNQAAAYNDVGNPDYQDADALAELRKKTNRNQTLVYPLLAVSGGLLFTATYQW